jgi:hypothetical protein
MMDMPLTMLFAVIFAIYMLYTPNTVIFKNGEHQKPPSPLLICMVLILSLLLLPMSYYILQDAKQTLATIQSQLPSYKSNSTLIAELPSQLDSSLYWMELEQRFNTRKLSDDEVQEIIQSLITYFQTHSVEDRAYLSEGGKWIEQLILTGQLKEPLSSELLKTFYGVPVVTCYRKNTGLEPWSYLQVDYPFSNSLSFPNMLEPCARLLQVTTKNEPQQKIDYAQSGKKHNEPLLIYRIKGLFLDIKETLPLGEQVLIFTYETRFDSGREIFTAPDETVAPLVRYTQQVQVHVLVDSDGNINVMSQNTIDDPASRMSESRIESIP